MDMTGLLSSEWGTWAMGGTCFENAIMMWGCCIYVLYAWPRDFVISLMFVLGDIADYAYKFLDLNFLRWYHLKLLKCDCIDFKLGKPQKYCRCPSVLLCPVPGQMLSGKSVCSTWLRVRLPGYLNMSPCSQWTLSRRGCKLWGIQANGFAPTPLPTHGLIEHFLVQY